MRRNICKALIVSIILMIFVGGAFIAFGRGSGDILYLLPYGFFAAIVLGLAAWLKIYDYKMDNVSKC